MLRLRLVSALALLAPLLSCGDSSGPAGLALKDPVALAAQLERIDHAIATPQLRSLGALAIPVHLLGIDIHTLSPPTLGRTVAWNSLSGGLSFTDRAGAPADAMRLILYSIDSTGRPAFPLVEVGTADLFPHNDFNGGGPDSTALRFLVTDMRTTPTVVADFLAHSHFQPGCLCAIVEGWVSDGTTRIDFQVPYDIIVQGPGRFPGTFSAATPAMSFDHFATLPGPGDSTATAELAVVFAGDSITTTSLLAPRASPLNESAVVLDGQPFATIQRTPSGITATGPGGRALTTAERRAVDALLALPAHIASFIEWPTFVIFYCGC